MTRIGVLALQGAFAEHIAMLERLGAEAFPVRLPDQLEGIDGLVIPGGESTTMGKLLLQYELASPIQDLVSAGLPAMGTCAGMILLARHASELNGYPLGILNIGVRRNAFGRQVDSFEIDIPVPALGEAPFHAIFIRAPWIETVGQGVEVLARLPDGTPVAARQGNVIGTAFHPELTDDTRFHDYFLDLAKRRGSCKK